MRERSNSVLSRVPRDLLVVGVVVLASSASFGVGMLAERERAGSNGGGKETGVGNGFLIEDISSSTAPALPASVASAVSYPKAPKSPKVVAPSIPVVPAGTVVAPVEGKYVASKNGTKYYLPGCSGAKRIKEENKVWFVTADDARKAGLSPASNCPGV